MNKIVISFLGDADRTTLNYAGVEKGIEKSYNVQNRIFTTNQVEIEQFLSAFNSDDESLLITFLAHGGSNGLSAKMSDDHWIRISYSDIMTTIGRCRTKHKVYLNLTASCKSCIAKDFINDNCVDELWYTSRTTDSLHNGLQAAKDGFDKFKFMDETGLYNCYLGCNP